MEPKPLVNNPFDKVDDIPNEHIPNPGLPMPAVKSPAYTYLVPFKPPPKEDGEKKNGPVTGASSIQTNGEIKTSELHGRVMAIDTMIGALWKNLWF